MVRERKWIAKRRGLPIGCSLHLQWEYECFRSQQRHRHVVGFGGNLFPGVRWSLIVSEVVLCPKSVVFRFLPRYRKIKGAFESDLHRADVDPQYLYHFGALQSALPCLTDPSKDLTPWWFPKQSFQIIMRLQKPTDIPLHEIARDLGAIALNFNEVIDSVMWGQLGTRKPGIKGTARSKALISRDPHRADALSSSAFG